MLYLLVTFFVLSCLASAVVLAAFMRSAQITHYIEEHGMSSLDPSIQAFHSVKIKRSHGHLPLAHRLTPIPD